MKKILNILLLPILSFTISFGQYDYSLVDVNPNSTSFQENVGPSLSPNQVTLHYFGYYYWGICSSRFEELNDLVEGLNSSGYSQLKLSGIGKSIHESSLDNWTSGNLSSVCMDESPYNVWNGWDADQRDLFVLDHNGNLVLHQNISGGIPNDLQSTIIDLIDAIPSGSSLGDINADGTINVIDVVQIVNIILSGSYTEGQLLLADMNEDGTINVIDVVQLVNIILN